MLSKQWVFIGATLGFFGVALGAFGAHALKETLSERALSIYQTGIQYQMIHALALIGLGVWGMQNPSVSTQVPGYAFTFGTLVFSGSLIALAVADIKPLGAITPIGGVSFLVGWFMFAFPALRA